MTALVEVRGLRKAYGERVVLDDVDLTVGRGEVVCLIGSSGSGKSTLLRCLDLLEEVDDGTIHLDGREITDPRVDVRDVRRRVGIVFQAYNLFPHLTVLDNVTLAPRKAHGRQGYLCAESVRQLHHGAGRPGRYQHALLGRTIRQTRYAGGSAGESNTPAVTPVGRAHFRHAGSGPEPVQDRTSPSGG